MSVFDELEKQLGTKKPSAQGDVFSDLESKLGIPKKEKPKIDWGGVAFDTALKFVGLKRKPQEVSQPQRDVNKYLQAKGVPYTEISQDKGGGIPLKEIEAGKHEEFKKKLQLKGIYPESKWKDVFDRLRSDAVNLLHNSKQYFLDNIPRMILREEPMPKEGSINDTSFERERIQKTNEDIREIKNVFKKISDNTEKQYQDWVKANPNLKPREEWNKPVTEILKRDPSAWKDPALWGYMASGSAVYTVGVIGTASVTTALTGNPLLGLGAGVAVTTPSLSRDLYNDLIENGATPEQANSLALSIGPVIATVEVVGDLPVLASFSAPFKKLLFGNIRKEVAERTLASLFKKGLTRFTTIEISETLEEVVQLAIQNATVRTVNENRQVFEGVSDTVIQTLMATAPIAIFGAGAEVKGIGVKTDTQIEEKPITGEVIPETKQNVFDDLFKKLQKKEVAPKITPKLTEGVAKEVIPEKGVIPKELDLSKAKITKVEGFTDYPGKTLYEIDAQITLDDIAKRSTTMPEYRDYDLELKPGGKEITKPIIATVKDITAPNSPIEIVDGWHRWRQAIANKDKTIPIKYIFEKPQIIKPEVKPIPKELEQLAQEAMNVSEAEFVSRNIFEKTLVGAERKAIEQFEGKTFADKLSAFYTQATQPIKEVVKPEVKEKPKGKPTKVAESIKAKAEEKGITGQFKGLAEYEPVVIKEQTRKIEKLMSEDIEKAKRMATGQEPLTEGIKGAMLIKMMEDYAMENRDGELILALANSPLVSETSEAGQTLRLIRERSPDSATARIQEVKKVREEVAKKKQRGKSKTEIKSDMKKDLKKNIEKQNKKVNKYAWSNFIDEITC